MFDTVCLAASTASWVLGMLGQQESSTALGKLPAAQIGSLHCPWHFLQFLNGVCPVKVLRNLVGSLLAQHPLADSRTWLQDAHAQVATAVQAGKQSLKGNR